MNKLTAGERVRHMGTGMTGTISRVVGGDSPWGVFCPDNGGSFTVHQNEMEREDYTPNELEVLLLDRAPGRYWMRLKRGMA